jgi:hypothetical protein
VVKSCWTVALLGVLFLFGCDPKTSTYPVSGTVTWDGKPLPDGDILFTDAENKVGPDAGKIKDGKFEFRAKPGKKKVEIRATRMEKLPANKKGAMGETELPTDYIPNEYNRETTLTADVAASGPNKYEFKLTPP